MGSSEVRSLHGMCVISEKSQKKSSQLSARHSSLLPHQHSTQYRHPLPTVRPGVVGGTRLEDIARFPRRFPCNDGVSEAAPHRCFRRRCSQVARGGDAGHEIGHPRAPPLYVRLRRMCRAHSSHFRGRLLLHTRAPSSGKRVMRALGLPAHPAPAVPGLPTPNLTPLPLSLPLHPDTAPLPPPPPHPHRPNVAVRRHLVRWASV